MNHPNLIVIFNDPSNTTFSYCSNYLVKQDHKGS